MLKEWREQKKSKEDKVKLAQGDLGSDEEDEEDEEDLFQLKGAGASPFANADDFGLGEYVNLSSLCDNSDEEEV